MYVRSRSFDSISLGREKAVRIMEDLFQPVIKEITSDKHESGLICLRCNKEGNIGFFEPNKAYCTHNHLCVNEAIGAGGKRGTSCVAHGPSEGKAGFYCPNQAKMM